MRDVMPQTRLQSVSRAMPCAVCEGDHKCSFSDDGLWLCGRNDGAVPGFRHLGPAKDPTWHLYRVDDPNAPRQESHAGFQSASKSAPVPSTPPPDFNMLTQLYSAELRTEQRQKLAEAWELPTKALNELPELGWSELHGVWTHPERDGLGRIVGLTRRNRMGQKRCHPGSQRGIIIPPQWWKNDGPIYIVEGLSDCCAMSWVGLSALGRPSARGGVDALIGILNDQAVVNRPIVVLGENDQKPDGLWPGKEGAEAVAEALRKHFPKRRVYVAVPPEGTKDAREWILAYWQAEGPTDKDYNRTIGELINQEITRVAATRTEPCTTRRSDSPINRMRPITELQVSDRQTGWIWDGFIARDRVTLFTALPKCGKTTLLGHLLRAIRSGGSFCGKPVMPAKAVILSEESHGEWVARRDALSIGDHVQVLSRPFLGKPSMVDWMELIQDLLERFETDPADLVIFDTLVDLWPAKDENSATEAHAALQPLRRLAEGRAVVLVHHMRKSDGSEGTGARGSGAILGFVDALIELRRPKGFDPKARKRELTANGRMQGIENQWVIELNKDETEFVHVGSIDEVKTHQRDDREAERRQAMKEAVLAVLPMNGDGWTREEIWQAIPDAVRKNENRLRLLLDEEQGLSWSRSGNGGRSGYRYRRSMDEK